ncbi:MAG: hypothetical protein KAS32_10650 [Candidatus Peribacteraceae bacterium]|nr:hypothetical protein [Candidatus Peribacteraceae bacterium]
MKATNKLYRIAEHQLGPKKRESAKELMAVNRWLTKTDTDIVDELLENERFMDNFKAEQAGK